MKVLVVGGGCFGSSTAVELATRGHSVTLLDRVKQSTNALTSATLSANAVSAVYDDNKIIRLDYALDALYTRLLLVCLYERDVTGGVPTWSHWPSDAFRQCGVLMLDNVSLDSATNSFAADSFRCLRTLGLAALRPPPCSPAFDTNKWFDGYYQPDGGWANPKQAVEDMLRKAESELGVVIINEYAEQLITAPNSSVVVQVRTDTGRLLDGFDQIVVAAGSRTPRLLPHLSSFLTPLALPIVHFKPREKDEELLRNMPVWASGIRQTGYYGFPLHPQTGYCKVGFHGQGWIFPPGEVDYNALTALHALVRVSIEQRFRDFLRTAVPALADAVHVKSKLCLYCDSCDSDFIVDRDIVYSNVVVVSGGSGHGFKFLPVIGPLAANVVDGAAPHEKLADAQRRFARLRERMQTPKSSLDACRSTAVMSGERDAQVREAIRQANAIGKRSSTPAH